MNNTVTEVAYYDSAEANLEKTPKQYTDFTYDNESDGGILQIFNDVQTKIKDIKSDISSLNSNYNTIIRKYDKFSNFESGMKSIINTMNTRIGNIEQCYKNILTTAQQAVNDHVATDKTLIDDLDTINALISGKTGNEAGFQGSSNQNPYNLTPEQLAKLPDSEKQKYLQEKAAYEAKQKDLDFKNSHGGYSEEAWNHLPSSAQQEILKNQAEQQAKGKITNQNETAVDDKYSMSSDLEKVADEIIQGKYGNAEERFAELEKQGYNLRDQYDANGNLIARGVQDIVNEKMNGTYDPNKMPTNTSNSEAAYRSSNNGAYNLDEDPASAASTSGQNLSDQGYPSSTDGYKQQAQAAAAAAQERGKAQTEYYQKQQAQAAVNAAQEKGKSTTEYYQKQQQAQNEAAKQQAIANAYGSAMKPQTPTGPMNTPQGAGMTPDQIAAINSGLQQAQAQKQAQKTTPTYTPSANQTTTGYNTVPPLAVGPMNTPQGAGLTQTQINNINSGLSMANAQKQAQNAANSSNNTAAFTPSLNVNQQDLVNQNANLSKSAAQAASNAAQERGKAQTSYYQNQMNNSSSSSSSGTGIYNLSEDPF